MVTVEPLKWAKRAQQALVAKKGEEVIILDMRDVTLIADYFVIASGQTPIQVAALADHVEEAMKEEGVPLLHRNGGTRSHWTLLDYGGVVVHIFTEDERHYYNLERLWGDASVIAEAEAPR